MVNFLLKFFIVTLMLSFGFKLTTKDILYTFNNSRLIADSLLINFLLIPTLALLFTQGLPLAKSTEVTLFLVSVAPGAPFAPKLVAIAGGDLASAIGLTFILSTVAIFFVPLMIIVASYSKENVFLSTLPVIVDLLFFQLLPLLIGLIVRCKNELVAKFLQYPVEILSDIIFVAILLVFLSNNFDAFSSISGISLIIMLLFNFAVLVSVWVLSTFNNRTRKSLILTTISRNITLVLFVSANGFIETNIESTLIVFSFIELIITLLISFYFCWFYDFN